MNLLIILLAFLPSFAWLFFYLHEENHPEPKNLIAGTFLMGFMFAFLALFVQIFINCAVNFHFQNCDTSLDGNIKFGPLLIILFAFVEELFKFLAAYFMLHKNSNFDEPVDAMIYMVVAALGFSALENFGVLSNATDGANPLLANIFQLTSLRFVGATLLHSLTSAVLGYYWALEIREFFRIRLIFWGLLIATFLHVIFNYLIMSFGGISYAIVFLMVVAFFVIVDFEKLRTKNL
jgi:protease PrsW